MNKPFTHQKDSEKTMRTRLIGAFLGFLLVAGVGMTQACAAADGVGPPTIDVPPYDGTPADMSKPVQVFVMLGQSNMVGMGAVIKKLSADHALEVVVKEQKLYPFLLDDAGDWVERKDVRYVSMVQGGDKKQVMHNEFLRVGGGSWSKPAAFMGIEYGVGHLLGNAYEEPVLLLKCSNGNRSLGYDLLPPGTKGYDFTVTEKKNKKDKKSTETVETTYTYAGYGQGPMRWIKGTTPVPPTGDAHLHAGEQYDIDIGNAKAALATIDQYYPGAKGYDVAGIFFWQGEWDSGDPGLAAHYEENLVNFITSVRRDLGAPDAKFVLGTIGEHVKGESGGNRKLVLEAHLAVDGKSGKYPEFKGNVATVYTHPYAQGGEGNAHYGKNSRVYMDVGLLMGQAMLELLGER
jgi:hypothetical protein